MHPNHVVMGTLLFRSGLNFAYKLDLLKHWLSIGLPIREGELRIIEKQMKDGKKLIRDLVKPSFVYSRTCVLVSVSTTEHYIDFFIYEVQCNII